MRSHPSCWNKTLTKLGLKRKKRRAKIQHNRQVLFESLEPRQMLAGDSVNITLADGYLDATTFAGNQELQISTQSSFVGDDFVAVEEGNSYVFSGEVRSGDGAGGQYNPNSLQYLGFASYDTDKLYIAPYHVTRFGNATDTHLAQALELGDTVVHLDDVTGWSNGGPSHTRTLAWYGYSNSSGEVYEDFTYTRNVLFNNAWSAGAVDYQANTITLQNPWAGEELQAGSAVRNTKSGGAYDYLFIDNNDGQPDDQWAQVSEEFDSQNFRSGTVYVRTIMLANYAEQNNLVTWRDVTIDQVDGIQGGQLVDLHVDADISGSPVTYQWFQVAGTPVELIDHLSDTPSFTAPHTFGGATLSFQVIVDVNGILDVATVDVRVKQAHSVSSGAYLESTTFSGSEQAERTTQSTVVSDDFVSVDPSQTYSFSGLAKSGDDQGGQYNPNSRHYLSFASYDIDENWIAPYHSNKYSSAVDTRLASPLSPGDTQVHLLDATGWQNGGATHQRSLAWYGYSNSLGEVYDDYTYTRNVLFNDAWGAGDIDYATNTITLSVPWAGPALAGGAAVRNTLSGGSYDHLFYGAIADQWTQVQETLDGQNFRAGTAKIKPLLLTNYVEQNNLLTWRDVTVQELAPLAGGQRIELHADVDIDGTFAIDGVGAYFDWQQLQGTPVNLQGTDTSSPSFTTPYLLSNEILSFEVTAFDEDGQTGTFTVNVLVEKNDLITSLETGGVLRIDDSLSGLDRIVIATTAVAGESNVTINGTPIPYAASTVQGIEIWGRDGNDFVDLSQVDLENFPNLIDGAITVYGGNGDDTLIGSEFGDIIIGEGGNDAINGGRGNDVYQFTGTSTLGTDTITELVSEGKDTLDFSDLNYGLGVSIDLSQGNSTQQVISSGGSQLTLVFNDSGNWEDIVGTAFDDTLIGNAQQNILVGNAGNDILKGLAGNDVIFGGAGADEISGGDDDDHLYGEAGADDIDGNGGDDTIEGGAGDDNLAGDTHFNAESIVIPFTPGNDTFVFSGTESLGTDTLVELDPNSTETLDFSSLDYGAGIAADLHQREVDISANGKQLHIDFPMIGGVANTRFENFIGTPYDDTFKDFIGPEEITFAGGDGDDTYIFNRALFFGNTLQAIGTTTIIEESGGGTDVIDFSDLDSFPVFGGVEVDLSNTFAPQNVILNSFLHLPSGSEIENVVGSDYDDRIIGNSNDNHLAGGLGDDTYVFKGSTDQGKDTIFDALGAGTDTVDFSGLDLGEGVVFDLREQGTDYEVINANGDQLILDLSGADLEQITGTIWDDVLTGDAGDNHIDGNAGNDLIQGREGTDTLDGGTGNDTFNLITGETTSTDVVTDADGYSIELPNGTTTSRPFIQLAKPTELFDRTGATPDTPVLIATVSDIESDLGDLTITVTGVDANDISIDLTTGKIFWSPDIDEIGQNYQITITVTDEEALTNTIILTAAVVAANTDTDGDGLEDLTEVVDVGTDPELFDTDGDLLGDGFEFGSSNGLLDPTSPDDPNGDADGDGLTNLDEQINDTDPGEVDSDGDGVPDFIEIGQGSDPNDPADGGEAPPEDMVVNLTLLVGDFSGSMSERYDLVVGPIRHQATQFGEVEDENYKFLKGKEYTITIEHRGTDPANIGQPGFPDYDYSADISLAPGETDAFIIDDPDDILRIDWFAGGDPELGGPFYAEGKSATLYIPHADLEIGDGVDVIPEHLEETEGHFVDLNIDDNDDDDVIDKDDTNGVVGEDDLVALTIYGLSPAGMPGVQTIEFNNSAVRVWENENRTVEVLSGVTEFSKTSNTSVYVEGIIEAEEFITLNLESGGTVYELDKVKVVIAGSILVAIDGTGSQAFTADPDYIITTLGGIERTQSHVKNFYDDYYALPGLKIIKHGPAGNTAGFLGTQAKVIHDQVWAQLQVLLQENPNRPVDIVGHSRGGAIAVEIARDLRTEGVLNFGPKDVRFLGLYDPVKMAPIYPSVISPGTISGNVEKAAVIFAAGGSDQVDRFPTLVAIGQEMFKMTENRSRSLFNRVDGGPESGNTVYNQIWIFGTHSAIGGAAWEGDKPVGHSDLNDRTKAITSDQFIRNQAKSGKVPINIVGDYGYDSLGGPRQ